MRLLLIYYTGTYNTRYLTEKIKQGFVMRKWQVDTVEIDSKTRPCSCEGYDLIGFSYPIYGFNSPLPFNKYVRSLKFFPGQQYFIYKNSGETMAMNNASSRILIRYMKKNKCSLVGEYHYVMPYNIHFPFENEFVKQIFTMNDKLMEIMFYNLEHNIVEEIKSNFIYNIAAFFVGIQKIGGNVNSFLYNINRDKCTQCGLCVRNCPQQNIYVKNGKIKFHHHCDMCMRCSFFCPTDAINIGFLQGWKVNNPYNYKKIEEDNSIDSNYINEKSKGFYKCFIKYFENIDNRYSEKIRDKSK